MNHGQPDHITWDRLNAAAKASGISPRDAAKNIRATEKLVRKAAKKADARTTITDVNAKEEKPA